MANKDKNNKTTRRDRLRKLVNGVQLHLSNVTALTIANVVHPMSDIIKLIGDDIAASDKSEQQRGIYLQQVAAEKASHQQVDPLVRGIVQYVRLNFGDTEAAQAVLADFGLTPRKKRVVSTAEKAAAASKAEATRKQRKPAPPATQQEAPAAAPAAAPATPGTKS